MLCDQGVVVAAGHCDPSFDQLRAAADAGLSLFTHLGNGCPKQVDRHDNIIQRVLSLSDRIRPCFIADGAHVPFFALRNYLRTAGLERCIVVTDAVSPAGLGPGRYRIGRWELDVGPDMVVRAPGDKHLVGSAGTMPRTLENLVQHVGLTEAQALRLTRDNPAAVLGLSA
jgi:N-acetylglucosamine-6-phosphate deacetylase